MKYCCEPMLKCCGRQKDGYNLFHDGEASIADSTEVNLVYLEDRLLGDQYWRSVIYCPFCGKKLQEVE